MGSICLTSDRAVASMHDRWLEPPEQEEVEEIPSTRCEVCGKRISLGDECYKWTLGEYICCKCIDGMLTEFRGEQ